MVITKKEIQNQEELVHKLDIQSNYYADKGTVYVREKLKLIKMKERYRNQMAEGLDSSI